MWKLYYTGIYAILFKTFHGVPGNLSFQRPEMEGGKETATVKQGLPTGKLQSHVFTGSASPFRFLNATGEGSRLKS